MIGSAYSTKLGKDALYAGAGLGIQWNDHFSTGLFYNISTGRGDYIQHIVTLSRDHAVEIYCGWLRTTTAALGRAVWAIEWWNHTQAQTALPSLHWRPSLSLATISTAWLRLSMNWKF